VPTSAIESGEPASEDAVRTANQSIARASQRLAGGLRPSMATAIILVLAAIAFSVWAIRYEGGATLFAARLIDGVTNGALYGLMALALVLVFKATRIINFAQGAMACVGAYLGYTFISQLGLSPVLGILAAIAASVIGAAAIERVFVRPFDPSNHIGIIMVTLAWFLILDQGVSVVYGLQSKGLPSPFPDKPRDYVTVFGAQLTYSDIGTIVTVLVVAALIGLLLRYTRFGLAFRAVASNLGSSRLVGIEIGRVVQVSWVLAAAAGTLAGCLFAAQTNLTPGFMDNILIYAFTAAALGGLDSLGGSIIGGLILGFIDSMIGGYVPQIGSGLSLGATFAVVVIALYLKPSGLRGRVQAERVLARCSSYPRTAAAGA
jgi:branched-chain amino acid transport system permease protein